jgi:hypothetical protein
LAVALLAYIWLVKMISPLGANRLKKTFSFLAFFNSNLAGIQYSVAMWVEEFAINRMASHPKFSGQLESSQADIRRPIFLLNYYQLKHF